MARNKNTITLMGSLLSKEGNAGEEIFPGYAITVNNAGLVVKQTQVLEPRIAVAVENDFLGKTIDDSYAVDERTYYKVPVRGSEMNMKVKNGATAIQLEDPLALSNDGTVVKHGGDVTAQTIIGFAKEAVDNSGGSVEVFIAVEIA